MIVIEHKKQQALPEQGLLREARKALQLIP